MFRLRERGLRPWIPIRFSLNISNSIDRYHAETLEAQGRNPHLESSHPCEPGIWDLLPVISVVNFGTPYHMISDVHNL
jgi:hypothetical protein